MTGLCPGCRLGWWCGTARGARSGGPGRAARRRAGRDGGADRAREVPARGGSGPGGRGGRRGVRGDGDVGLGGPPRGRRRAAALAGDGGRPGAGRWSTWCAGSRTLALLDDGAIPYASAAHLARGVDDLCEESAALVEDRVLPRLPRLTPAEARRAVADAVVRVDPAAARERAERKKRERRIERVPDRDGRTGWFVPMTVADEASGVGPHERAGRRRSVRPAGLPASTTPAWTRCASTSSSTCSWAPSPTSPKPPRSRGSRPACGWRAAPAAASRSPPWSWTSRRCSGWRTSPAWSPATALVPPGGPGDGRRPRPGALARRPRHR